ncbi:MAG: hypothetical protein M1546_24635 [Chloroflexi bacterium]|nr:hypothetical protein [Chloroflexota bacterium]
MTRNKARVPARAVPARGVRRQRTPSRGPSPYRTVAFSLPCALIERATREASKGERTSVSAVVAKRLAQAYGVDPEAVLTESVALAGKEAAAAAVAG